MFFRVQAVQRRDALLVLLGAGITHLMFLLGSTRISLDQSISVDAHIEQTMLNPIQIPETIDVHPPETYSGRPETSVESFEVTDPIQIAPKPLDLPHTSLVAHVPGWTIFRNLYMSNGTLYIVSSNTSFPEIRMITSTGLPAFNTPENIASREPTAQDMDFITPEEARARWGSNSMLGENNRVWSINGNTFLVNDPSQFLAHYYHFVAELIFGAWSFWTGAWTAPSFSEESTFRLSHPPPPQLHRVVFPHSDARGWRDSPGFNGYFLRAAFPSIDVEVQDDWADRVAATSDGTRAWHFPIVLFADRSAAFRGSICGTKTQRTASEALEFMRDHNRLLGQRAGGWWQPLREALWSFAGATPSAIEEHVDFGSNLQLPMPEKVVITYISRQGVPRRKLKENDHADLVAALEALVRRKGDGWELVVLQAEKISKDKQVKAAARATILLGVHGNGLTHLVFMRPTRASAVIEIFYPGGFAHDYQWTSRALGMDHYAVWNDRYITYPDEPQVDYPEGFQGNEIPVNGATVARLIEEHVDKKRASISVD